jgi:hypothetical protein
MNMSDCERCWTTPCQCGWDYIGWSKEQLKSQIQMLNNILGLTINLKGDKEIIKKEFLRLQKERMVKK